VSQACPASTGGACAFALGSPAGKRGDMKPCASTVVYPPIERAPCAFLSRWWANGKIEVGRYPMYYACGVPYGVAVPPAGRCAAEVQS
jgi:hypothetical protein